VAGMAGSSTVSTAAMTATPGTVIPGHIPGLLRGKIRAGKTTQKKAKIPINTGISWGKEWRAQQGSNLRPLAPEAFKQ